MKSATVPPEFSYTDVDGEALYREVERKTYRIITGYFINERGPAIGRFRYHGGTKVYAFVTTWDDFYDSLPVQMQTALAFMNINSRDEFFSSYLTQSAVLDNYETLVRPLLPEDWLEDADATVAAARGAGGGSGGDGSGDDTDEWWENPYDDLRTDLSNTDTSGPLSFAISLTNTIWAFIQRVAYKYFTRPFRWIKRKYDTAAAWFWDVLLKDTWWWQGGKREFKIPLWKVGFVAIWNLGKMTIRGLDWIAGLLLKGLITGIKNAGLWIKEKIENYWTAQAPRIGQTMSLADRNDVEAMAVFPGYEWDRFSEAVQIGYGNVRTGLATMWENARNWMEDQLGQEIPFERLNIIDDSTPEMLAQRDKLLRQTELMHIVIEAYKLYGIALKEFFMRLFLEIIPPLVRLIFILASKAASWAINTTRTYGVPTVKYLWDTFGEGGATFVIDTIDGTTDKKIGSRWRGFWGGLGVDSDFGVLFWTGVTVVGGGIGVAWGADRVRRKVKGRVKENIAETREKRKAEADAAQKDPNTVYASKEGDIIVKVKD
jgi:hypothetical protein